MNSVSESKVKASAILILPSEGIKVDRPVNQPRLGQALHLRVRNVTMWKNIVRRIGETTGFQDVVQTRMDTYFFCLRGRLQTHGSKKDVSA